MSKDYIAKSKLIKFNKLFISANYTDDFGWSHEWNAEIEKWLYFVIQKDTNFYKMNKNRVRSDKQRDELLGEYKAAYFIGSLCSRDVLEFEPNGKNNKKLDFSFKDKNGDLWLAEVKSPSWRNEVAKEIEGRYLRDLRSRLIFKGLNESNDWKAEATCPLCNNKINLEIKGRELDNNILGNAVKSLTCSNCKKHIWKSLESNRAGKIKQRLAQPQFINGEGGSFSSNEAIEDAVRKAIGQFEKGNNNLLIITPNMFINTGLLPAIDNGHRIRKLLSKYDTKKIISCILILEVSLPAVSNNFRYTDIWIPVKDKQPNL